MRGLITKGTETVARLQCFCAFAQTSLFVFILLLLASLLPAHGATVENRIALVIGNSNYDSVIDLDNSGNDARAMAALLRQLGFEVEEHIDRSEAELEKALRDFSLDRRHADVALFYYAGHAIQYEGENYIVPTDASLETVSDIDRQLIRLGTILQEVQGRGDMSLIFLDAFRNNPFTDMSGVTRAAPMKGLSALRAERNSFVAFATEPGNVAYDSAGGRHSPFTAALLRHIESPGLEINHLMNRVRDDVIRVTEGLQVPWDQSSLLSEFYFKPGEKKDDLGLKVELAELNDILRVQDSAVQLQRLRAFQQDHPESSLLGVAERTIQGLLDGERRQNRNTTGGGEGNQSPVLAAIPELVVEAGEGGQPLPIAPPRDPDRDELEIEVQEVPSSGTLRYFGRQIKVGDLLSADELKESTYHPPFNFAGPAGQFTFRVNDGRGGATVGAMKIRILDANNPPVFNPPRLVMATIGAPPILLDKDLPTDPDADDSVLVEIRKTPSKGHLTLSGFTVEPGQLVTAEQYTEIRYRPPDDFAPGGDVIELVAGDGRRQTIRNIEIRLNRPPSFGDDVTVRIVSDGHAEPLNFDLPTDADDNVLKVTVKALPRNGGRLMVGDRTIERGNQLTLDEFKKLTFKPDERFAGVAGRLRLEVDDGFGGVDVKMVDLKIDRPNVAPLLRNPDLRLLVVAGQFTPLNILAPFDRDGDELTITIVELSEGGRFLAGDRELRQGDQLTMGELLNLAVIADRESVDQAMSIAYEVDDKRGGLTVGSIEMIVEAPNTLPIAPHKGLLTFRADEAPFQIMGDQRPSDPDGDPVTVSIQHVPEVGTILIGKRRINPGDTVSVDQLMRISYQPPTGFAGFAGLFRYLVRDSRGGTANGFFELIIEPANRAPLAADIAGMEIEGGDKKSLSLLPPHDPDDDPLEIQIVELSEISGLTLNLDDRILSKGDMLDVSDLSRIRVEATLDAVGREGALLLEIRDGKGGNVITGKDIKVIEPPNRAPVIRLSGTVQVTKGEGPQDLGLLEPTDPEGDSLTVRLTALPTEGMVQLRGETLEVGAEVSPTDLPELRFDPGDELSGVLVWISFLVMDDRMAEATGNVPINIVAPANRPPLLSEQPVVNAVVGVGQIPLPVEPPTDPDRDQLTIKITSLPSHGRLTFGRRKAFEGMELTVDAFVDARFTPDPPRKKRQVAGQDVSLPSLSSSSLVFVADDGRGGVSEGEVEIRIVLHPCDQQASTPDHPDSVAEPVTFDSIDADLAIKSCQTALADYGNIVRFRVQLGRALHAGGHYTKAKNAYFEATNAGDPVAQHNLALLILNPPADLDARGDERAFAIRLLLMASNAGLITAQKHLAQAIWDLDRSKALQWLERASEQQDPEAMMQLAMAYAHDDEAEHPFERIVELLESAEALGLVEAATNLGYVYAEGVRGKRNYGQAVTWFQKAMDLGDMKAAINLGNLYRHGLGTSPSPIDAIELFAMAACSKPEDVSLREIAVGYLDEMPVIDRNSAIQSKLRQHGYDLGPGEEATSRALLRYQGDQGMPKNGVLSTATLLNLWGCGIADGAVN